MNDPLINLQDSVQKTTVFSGQLQDRDFSKSTKVTFSRPVTAAKVIAKHETGDTAYGTVQNVEVQDNCVIVKMTFKGTVGGHYNTAIVLNITL